MRILLGMSGGLDSAWSARLLREAGHDVCGAYLIMHGEGEAREAKAAAEEAGIELLEIDCRARFFESVISDFCREYREGRTPNPCVVCNSEVKLRELLRVADERGFDRIATGHYARVLREGARYAIYRGADPTRDQSYVLWRLGQQVLSRLVLPLGESSKSAVLRAAHLASLSAAYRPESREICFIPDHDYAGYIERTLGACPEGDFVDADGRVLGKHRGILHYTVGQRRGLGVALGERMYVSEIRAAENRVVLSKADGRGVTSFYLHEPVFSGCEMPGEGEELCAEVAIRYQAKPVPAVLRLEQGRWRVHLTSPLPAVTAGQSAVFYRGDKLLLGGFIRSTPFSSRS